jgi:anti-sigma regulatory factor (Ser/Thr protein kinase)
MGRCTVTTCTTSRLILADRPAAPRDARRFVTNFARTNHWRGSLQDAVLVTDELVTNAVTHTQAECVLECQVLDATLRLAVHDRDPTPAVPNNTPGRHGGYGLRIIDALSQKWGNEPEPTGKVIWAELQ